VSGSCTDAFGIISEVIELAGKNEGVENAATSQARHPRTVTCNRGHRFLPGARVNPVKYLDDVIVASKRLDARNY